MPCWSNRWASRIVRSRPVRAAIPRDSFANITGPAGVSQTAVADTLIPRRHVSNSSVGSYRPTANT